MTTVLRITSLLVLGFLFSCSENRIYDSYIPVAPAGWHADSTAQFEVEITDTTLRYAIYLNMRHNSTYPFRNIWFFRTIESGKGVEYTDTINYVLADEMGKWLGQGIGETKQVIMPFKKEALFFNKAGSYTFEIQHGMRDTVLEGVTEIGLEVFAQTPNE